MAHTELILFASKTEVDPRQVPLARSAALGAAASFGNAPGSTVAVVLVVSCCVLGILEQLGSIYIQIDI